MPCDSNIPILYKLDLTVTIDTIYTLIKVTPNKIYAIVEESSFTSSK